ncbi:MAG: SDR family NAD(P)-dependent oxidoreductase [Hyalangium sp.]|uniref:SDR family NAD(P)-dependent oxidoreductase n=1 Tax=Hyalangium sp. TaxID=2028555 RepID=UPI00389A69AA
MKRLQNKVAIITGGGSGIGAATAALFAQEGAKVMVVGRTQEKLQKTVQAINQEHVGYCVADVSKAEDTQRYLRETVQRFGGVDVLVSNAGDGGFFKPITEYSVEDFDQLMATNVRGVWLSAKYAFPLLSKRGGGSIIITSSIAGLGGFPTASPYVASKHAVIGLARALSYEGAPHRIRINAVCPGATDTNMAAEMHRQLAPGNEAYSRVCMENRIPLKRYGTDEEIARLNLFLASDESSYMTGGVHVADGGWSAGLI